MDLAVYVKSSSSSIHMHERSNKQTKHSHAPSKLTSNRQKLKFWFTSLLRHLSSNEFFNTQDLHGTSRSK